MYTRMNLDLQQAEEIAFTKAAGDWNLQSEQNAGQEDGDISHDLEGLGTYQSVAEHSETGHKKGEGKTLHVQQEVSRYFMCMWTVCQSRTMNTKINGYCTCTCIHT